jgi:hypothetical protein
MDQDKCDWSFSLPPKADFQIDNSSHRSSPDQAAKLLRYMLSNLSAHHLLPLVGAMIFSR